MPQQPEQSPPADFLSAEWLEAAPIQLVEAEFMPRDLLVQFVAVSPGGKSLGHFQQYTGGHLSEWSVGERPEASFCLVHSWIDAWSFHTRSLDDPDGLAARSLVVEQVEGVGVRRLLPPPLDMLSTTTLDLLPRIEGASFTYNLTLFDSPFGSLDIWQRFEDGQRVDAGVGTIEDAEAGFIIRYENFARMQRGLIEAPEALEGGNLSGEWDDLQMVVGVIESEGSRRCWIEEGCRAAPDLGYLGSVMSSTSYTDFADQLRGEHAQ